MFHYKAVLADKFILILVRSQVGFIPVTMDCSFTICPIQIYVLMKFVLKLPKGKDKSLKTNKQ